MNEFKPAPVKPLIPFSTFETLDIRVGTIQKVEKWRALKNS